MADQYDSPWKEAIERHFADFLLFFFPETHTQVDWEQPIVFLDQELRAVVRDSEIGTRHADKLVRLTRRGNAPELVFVHLEIQGDEQAEFPERMFVYNYRLYDRYRKPVASLAVLTDDRLNWRPDNFSVDLFGSAMTLRYPVAKLSDWTGREAVLEDSNNPFAMVTLAHLATRSTRKDMAARYAAKKSLMRQLYRSGKQRQQVLDLLCMIDWMMHLPKDWERVLQQDLKSFEQEIEMPYVSSFERAGIEQGLKQGLEQGIQQGQAKILMQQLERRFGELPQWARDRLEAAGPNALEAWADAVLSAVSIESVFGTSTH